jgi:hypothetical protein
MVEVVGYRLYRLVTMVGLYTTPLTHHNYNGCYGAWHEWRTIFGRSETEYANEVSESVGPVVQQMQERLLGDCVCIKWSVLSCIMRISIRAHTKQAKSFLIRHQLHLQLLS